MNSTHPKKNEQKLNSFDIWMYLFFLREKEVSTFSTGSQQLWHATLSCCIAILPSFSSLNLTYITLKVLSVDLNPITLPIKQFTSLSSKLIFVVNITWAPFLISKLQAKLHVSFIFLACMTSGKFNLWMDFISYINSIKGPFSLFNLSL